MPSTPRPVVLLLLLCTPWLAHTLQRQDDLPEPVFDPAFEDDPRWPQALIIGTQKAATTSVFDWLARHINLTCPMQNNKDPDREIHSGKEAHFFDATHGPEIAQQATLSPEEARRLTMLYLDLFGNKCSAPVRMEATPNYLHNRDAPIAIYRLFPPKVRERLRLVILLREPVHRLLSWYNHQLCDCQPVQGGPFKEKCLTPGRRKIFDSATGGAASVAAFFGEYHGQLQDHTENGMYYFHIQHWLKYFRRSQMFILSYEVLHDPSALQRLASFILNESMEDVEKKYSQYRRPGFEPFDLGIRANAPTCQRKQNLTCSLWDKYKRLYFRNTLQLYQLLAKTRQDAPVQEPEWLPFHEGDALNVRCRAVPPD